MRLELQNETISWPKCYLRYRTPRRSRDPTQGSKVYTSVKKLKLPFVGRRQRVHMSPSKTSLQPGNEEKIKVLAIADTLIRTVCDGDQLIWNLN